MSLRSIQATSAAPDGVSSSRPFDGLFVICPILADTSARTKNE
jgi:hypothetical protein